MNTRKPHPSIPAEAVARQARLQAALRAMEELGPSREPACLRELRAMLLGRSVPDADVVIEALVREDLVEEGGEVLRAFRREAGDRGLLDTLRPRLAPLVERAQQRRSAHWQLDTRRTLIRFSYAKEGEGIGFDEGDLHAIFLQALRLEGLRVALDLGKRPRPLLSSGLPLPAGVGGLAESMDALLQREPPEDPAAMMARLNRRLPPGLRIHEWTPLPVYASLVGDLAQWSHWRWEVPPGQRVRARERVSAFLATAAWPWVRGTSQADALDLRTVLSGFCWEDGALVFATRMGPFQAINPLKMLGAVLDLDPAGIGGLLRTRVDLKPDDRLAQAERFEPKLKNMYEDAVLLGGGSNITLVDEDDDEPLRLG